MIFRKVKIEKVKTSRFLKHGLQISCWCFNLLDIKIVKDEMHKIILINVYPRYLKKKQKTKKQNIMVCMDVSNIFLINKSTIFLFSNS